jgi:hypothetical protein
MSTGIITITLADGTEPPSFLEFGISTSAEQLPSSAQLSNEFVGLANGIYYIFYRKIGSSWNINCVIVKEVNCNDGIIDTSSVISKRLITVNNVSNGHTFTFIDNVAASTIDNEYYFICDFFSEETSADNSYGSKISYVDYKKNDKNTIELIMDEGVTFTGTIIIQRL